MDWLIGLLVRDRSVEFMVMLEVKFETRVMEIRFHVIQTCDYFFFLAAKIGCLGLFVFDS